jgi:hypothetical protein
MTMRSLLGGALALVGATFGFAVCPEITATSSNVEAIAIETRISGFITMFLPFICGL